MDLDEQLQWQQVQGRLNETEAWLAMLMVLFGEKSTTGWQMRICGEHAALMRKEMPRGELRVQIGYEPSTDMYSIDAI